MPLFRPIPVVLPTLALIAVCPVAPAAAPAVEPFTFVHVSDTHVGSADGNVPHAETDARMFREMSALSPRPAFVAGTGDVVENGTPEQYALYQEVLKSLAVPMYMSTGNHDVRWNPLGKEGFVKGAKQPLWQSWDYHGVHFVLLDSTVLLEHWGHMDHTMLQWLATDLEKAGTEVPVVIGFHHWIGRDVVQVDNEQELLDLVAPYNVRLWLQGHGHADIQWNVNGTPAVMVGGLYQQSYTVVTVGKDTLSVERRMAAKKGRKGELLGAEETKKAPAADAVVHRKIVSVPLKKPVAPKWSAGLRDVTITVAHGDLPADATIAYRVDTEKYLPLASDTATVDTKPLVPGVHVLTVQATLPDGRAYQKPLTLKVPGNIAPAWTADVKGEVQSTLVRSGKSLYLTTMAGDLVSLDPSTGHENWRFHAEGPNFSSPFVDESTHTVYFGSADHRLYAVDAASGKRRWAYETPAGVFASPAVAKGIVAITSTDKTVYGVDAATGSPRWTAKVEGMYQSKTATDGEHFFIAGWDNRLRDIDAATGKEVWAVEMGKAPSGKIAMPYSPAIASPTVGDGRVFVCTNDGTLRAVDVETGKQVWTFCNKRLGYSGPLFHDHKVYVAIGDPSKVFCLDAATGKPLWMTGNRDPRKELTSASSEATPVPNDLPGEATMLPVIYDSGASYGQGHVYIGSVDGTFHALDADTGKIAWQYRLGPGHLLDSPATDGDKVYISSMSGLVTALPLSAK